jgi:hypothetical protein
MASMHSNFFQGQMDRGLFYWPNHSVETQLSNQEEDMINVINLDFEKEDFEY